MNIVIIANFVGLKNRPDKLDYYFFEHLKINSKYKITLCENDIDEIKKNINEQSILIIFSCYPELTKYSNKKIYYVYDICCTCKYGCDGTIQNCKFNEQKKYIDNNNFDHIWYKYETPITIKLYDEYKCFKFPHMIFNPDIHKDYNLEKKYDILFFGATYQNYYPLRNKLYYILLKNNDKFNVKFIPYTKKHPEKMITGIELSKLISQSWLTCACCAINSSLVAKYYEIGLCGSVVLGDYPKYETEQYLRENIIYVDLSMSDDEILNVIIMALNDKKKLEKYSINTKKYISENYMYKNGVERFDDFFDNLSNK
jgi:hypothetical protein